MKKILLLLSLIVYTTHINGMKRPHNKEIDHPYKKPRTEDKVEQYTEKPFLLLSLPPELQNIIFEYMTFRITAFKQKRASKAVKALSHVNKFYNAKINNLSFSDALIDTFSWRFNCANETIARNLATRESLKRLHMQIPLKQLSFSTEKITPQSFNDIINTKTVNLEFTYTHTYEQKTALMISIDYPNNMYDRLLENGAQINGSNAQGWSALSLATKSKYAYKPYRRVHFYKLIQQPEISLNHQDLSGKSPLYHLLLSIKKHRFYATGNDIAMVRALLQAGADPELPDRKKITPLHLAYETYNPAIIELFENAIADKHVDVMTIDT